MCIRDRSNCSDRKRKVFTTRHRAFEFKKWNPYSCYGQVCARLRCCLPGSRRNRRHHSIAFRWTRFSRIRIALNASPILTAKHEIRFSSRLLFSTYSKKARHEFQIQALLSVLQRVLSLLLDRNTPRILVLVLDSFKFWKLHLLVPNRQETEEGDLSASEF